MDNLEFSEKKINFSSNEMNTGIIMVLDCLDKGGGGFS